MSRPTITIQDAVTDKIETREMNDEEFAVYQSIQAEAAAEAEAAAKLATDKAAVQAKLEALGLTSDDLKALGL
jgi:hypothetical protein